MRRAETAPIAPRRHGAAAGARGKAAVDPDAAAAECALPAMPARFFAPNAALLLAACLWAGSAAAQVMRCSDPATGKITYTDGDCAAGQARKEVAPRQTTEDIQRERDQAQEALRLKRERRALEAAQASPAPVDRPRQDADTQRAPDPAQSAECAQARQSLKAALARDPSLYDTNTHIHSAQRNEELACLTPVEIARLQRDREQRSIYGNPGFIPPVVIVPPLRPHHPHHTQPRPKPEMVQCNVFRCYDRQGNSYPR